MLIPQSHCFLDGSCLTSPLFPSSPLSRWDYSLLYNSDSLIKDAIPPGRLFRSLYRPQTRAQICSEVASGRRAMRQKLWDWLISRRRGAGAAAQALVLARKTNHYADDTHNESLNVSCFFFCQPPNEGVIKDRFGVQERRRWNMTKSLIKVMES